MPNRSSIDENERELITSLYLDLRRIAALAGSSMSKDFEALDTYLHPWFVNDHPEDVEHRESFKAFAESGELEDAYAAGYGASARTPDCATENLEAWAARCQSNGKENGLTHPVTAHQRKDYT